MKNTEEISGFPNAEKPDVELDNDKEQSLSNYLGPGAVPEDIEPLRTAQTYAGLYPLFKELVRTDSVDFFMKMAILLVFSRDNQKVNWTPQELATEFFWLQEGQRKRIVSQLSRSNWLNFSDGAYQLSTFGRSILSMITALVHQEGVPDALGANISSMSLVEMYQKDPLNTLRMFLNELVRIDEEIEHTLETKSEYLIAKLNKQIRSQFEIAIKSREHLENLPTNDFQSYRLKQQIHERLSSFHARLSQVQRIQNDLIARRIVLADQSLTHQDISTFLINSSVEKLAKMARRFISTPIRIPDVIPPLIVYETEWQLTKSPLAKKERRGWMELEEAAESKEDVINRSRVFQFVGEMEIALDRKKKVALEEFIPQGNWATSCFRFSMLPILESGEIPCIQSTKDTPVPQIKVTYPDNVAEVPVAVLNDNFSGVKEIVRGIISRATDATSSPQAEPHNTKEGK